MKRFLPLIFIPVAGVAMGQTGTLDNFESYADTTALKAVWAVKNGNAGEDAVLVTSGGANGTSKYMNLKEGGFSAKWGAANLGTKTAGNYKLKFYYQNGPGAALEWKSTNVVVKQGTNTIHTLALTGSTTPEVATWTLKESANAFPVNGTDPIYIEFSASSVGAAGSYELWIDEIVLEQDLNVALAVSPDPAVRLSGTVNVQATPSGGSGTYSSVTFDVGDNGSVDFTDNSAPFEFAWNTTTAVPTSGTIALKVTATDSLSNTKSVTNTYTVDNEYGGRESLIVNGDFASFAAADGDGNRLPTGWAELNHDMNPANATYGPDTDRQSGAGNSLKVTFASSATDPNTSGSRDRYTVRSNAVTGNFRDHQVSMWAKGAFARLYYWTSADNGATWANTNQIAASVSDTNWTFNLGAVYTPPNQNDATRTALATHVVGSASAATTHNWDDITWNANQLPASTSGVAEWNLFE